MEDFSNKPLDVDTLPDYEKVPLNTMHKDYLKVMYFSVGIFMMILALGLIIFYVFNSFISEYILVFSGLYFAFLGLNFWLTRLRFKKRGYALREKDIIYQRGVLSTHTTIVPFNRIQHVAINEPVILRLFDLAALQIYTAGGSSSDLQLSGLTKAQAHKIKSFLMLEIASEVEAPEMSTIDTLVKETPDKDGTLTTLRADE